MRMSRYSQTFASSQGSTAGGSMRVLNRPLESNDSNAHMNRKRTSIGSLLMSNGGSISKTAIDNLGAIARFRRQYRSNRGWLVGNKRIPSGAIAALEQKSLLREVAFNGEPTLILTEDGKRVLAEQSRR